MSEALRIGLIGAGPWAGMVYAPAIAGHPGAELVSVWARRPAAAEDIARPHGAAVAADVDELLDAVDAVAFAVPPSVQPGLAIRAAQAGKHLLLEKPLAVDLRAAFDLRQAVEDAGVAALMLLTRRYDPATAAWLAEVARSGGWVAGEAKWLANSVASGPFSNSPWRKEHGALLDVGPHVLDLLDAALGRIGEVSAAHTDHPDLYQLFLAHETGATSVATLSLSTPVPEPVVDTRIWGAHGQQVLPDWTITPEQALGNLISQLIELVATGEREHPCDVRRGTHLQSLIEVARIRLSD